MKRFIMMLVCAVALCGCTRFSNAENPKSGSITAVHSEDCQCKTNK